jgi:hypothetical protein
VRVVRGQRQARIGGFAATTSSEVSTAFWNWKKMGFEPYVMTAFKNI